MDYLMMRTREAVSVGFVYQRALNSVEIQQGPATECAARRDRDVLAEGKDFQSVELVRRYDEWLGNPDHSHDNLWNPKGY